MRDTGFRETHNIVKRLIRLTIETGFVTGQIIAAAFQRFLVPDTVTISASFSIITMALAYIPGPVGYYQIGILILAKMYSNSMIAALNSRMKVVPNSEFGSPPSWNESAKQTESCEVRAQDLAFRQWVVESVDSREDAIRVSLTF